MTPATPSPTPRRLRMRMLAGGLLVVAGGVWTALRREKTPSASGKGEVPSFEQGKRFGGSVKGAEDGKQVGRGKERDSCG